MYVEDLIYTIGWTGQKRRSKMAPALFVYGSLMATEVLAAVLGPDNIAGLTLTPAILQVSVGDA